MTDEECQQIAYRLGVAVDLLKSGSQWSDDERMRMTLIIIGQPEELLERLRKEEPLNIWSPADFRRDFDALGFMAPLVHARRKLTGEDGILMFTHLPRWYFGWIPKP